MMVDVKISSKSLLTSVCISILTIFNEAEHVTSSNCGGLCNKQRWKYILERKIGIYLYVISSRSFTNEFRKYLKLTYLYVARALSSNTHIIFFSRIFIAYYVASWPLFRKTCFFSVFNTLKVFLQAFEVLTLSL